MKRIIAAALVAILVLTTGCGKHAEETPKTESEIEVNKTEEELRDERELTAIAESELFQPERVAALSRNAAAMWKLAGGTIAVGVEEIGGVSKSAVCGTEDSPDIDAVLELTPDLILLDRETDSYEEIASLLDITEESPACLTIDIHSFDDYADGMLEMAKYTKDAGAYKTRVIDVRKKNAEVISRGREALNVLIQTMPLPETFSFAEDMDESMAGNIGDIGLESTIAGMNPDSVTGQDTESALDSIAESYPSDPEKVANKRESVTVLLIRGDADGCTIQGGHDYVSNMFADFGLTNVNPGYDEVRVDLPKEDEAVVKSMATGTEVYGDPETDAEVDGSTETGVEVDDNTEIGAEVDSKSETEKMEEDQAASGTESSAEIPLTIAGQEPESKGNSSDQIADGVKAVDTAPAGEIEFETILRRNPDYIFVIYEGKEKEAEKTYKKICESREFWGNLTAVRNRHVYTLPQSTFASPPNDQWDLAYEYLYQMMFVM